MADGHIKISIEVDGKEVEVASKSLDNLEDAGIKGGRGVKETEDGLKNVGKESDKASGNIKKFAGALGLVAIGAAAFKVLKSSLDDAITRFDTLNKFPKVLEGLGVSADDAERSTTRLADGIDGLPTKLDEIASTAQRMYTSFGDMDKATDSALALNNALLGSGASSDQARRGTEQYLKALQTGKFDMDTWNTLSETMDVGLVKIAESFGYAGASAKDDLYNALKDGSVTIDDFNDKLIEVGTGTGIMAKLAKENSLGISTSFGNLRYAVARGITGVLDSLNKLSVAVTGNDIAENIDGMKHIVVAAFNVISGAIEVSIPLFKILGSVMSALLNVAKSISPVLIGMATAFAIHTVINRSVKAMDAFRNATILSEIASKRAAATTLLVNAGRKVMAGITTAATLAELLFTRQITLGQVAMLAKAAASKVLGTALKVMSGPVGWVTLGVGALAGAVVGVVKWFRRASEEGERLTAETEELGNATNELAESVDSSAESYKKSQVEIEGTAKANEELAQKISDLANQESRSATEKEMLKTYTEQLNESVEGLNLAYDEESDALNMSNEQMEARLGLFAEQETANEAQERLTEIIKEQTEAEQQLAETNELRQEWNDKLEDGSVRSREHKKAIEELDEQEDLLRETLSGLAEQQEITEETMTQAMEAITEATESGVANQIILFDDLSESQQATIENMKGAWEDYKDAATDMFDTLSDEAELTVAEMTANLEENQRIIGEWSEGIATLAERGVDEGLLNTLRDAGPESAGYVKELVNASDTELDKLSETFSKGGKSATDALAKSLGIDETEIMDAIGHLVVDTEVALKDQIKASNFEDIGGAIPEGVEKGIIADTGLAEKAAEAMAKATDEAFKAEAGIQSPSTVFKESGTDLAEGLALGISDSHDVVKKAITDMFKTLLDDSKKALEQIDSNYKEQTKKITASLGSLVTVTGKGMDNMLNKMQSGAKRQTSEMTRLAASIVSPFSSTRSQFSAIGANAMSGLNAGLNAGRASVIGVARGIANSVASTMQSALRIHSPSRVMRDDIGKWIPAGIAEGMEDNFSFIDKAIQGMNDKFSNMRIGTPEMALGTHQMGYAFSAPNTTNNQSNLENIYNTTNMEGMFRGANFSIRDDKDISKLAKELGDYMKSSARRKGVVR